MDGLGVWSEWERLYIRIEFHPENFKGISHFGDPGQYGTIFSKYIVTV
jgi:hypothetical protein